MKESDTIELIFSRFHERMFKQMHYERTAFDPISTKIFGIIYNAAVKNGCYKGSCVYLSRALRVSDRKVRYRLKHLARYGFISVHWVFKKTGINAASNITVNPILLGMISSGAAARHINAYVEHYFMLGFNRLDNDSDNDIQGFKTDILYGKPEPVLLAGDNDQLQQSEQEQQQQQQQQQPWEKLFIGIVAAKDEREKTKREDDLNWLGLSNSFVTACGSLWTRAQGELGYGYNKAAWDGLPAVLGATHKRERQELVKLFYSWGGLHTALAWYIFVASLPTLDNKGNPVFDLKAPHKQFVTIDKKPTQFAKHFNAILTDAYFTGYINNEKFKETLEPILIKYFGDLLNVEPRYEQNKLDIAAKLI